MKNNVENIKENINEINEIEKPIVKGSKYKHKDLGIDIVDLYKTPKDEILEIEDWDIPFEEMFPLTYVANLSGLKIYTRQMTMKQQSNFVEQMKKLNNNIEFMGKTICELAYLEDGTRAFPSGRMNETILSKRQDMVLKLYLKLIDVANPDFDTTFEKIKRK
ncbi:hypothetical protein B5E87_00290 [Massilimicrobiota sp. An142]|uniref:hypothetical protein n=1 Tax=Massilimicrobiota sp. An142 TaxID=1965564 RepID=UPI000B38FD8E|nr:hypothetical protein [Massilimicrobiota sp. An142]OUQ15044.1 hypothetical protein B5E87_00290 [Massilimicrobiota sp. An142]